MIDALFKSENYLLAQKLLDATAARHAALSANIANVETPGYKRVDISVNFDNQLKEAARTHDIRTLVELKPTLVEDTTAPSVRPDGNNVQLDKELMEVNRNETNYEYLAQYLSNNLKQLESAIRTQGN